MQRIELKRNIAMFTNIAISVIADTSKASLLLASLIKKIGTVSDEIINSLPLL
jgi:hypothetical protein